MAQIFNARKSAQVIAYLVSLNGQQSMSVLKAIKLVYLGDRASIEKYGFPILDETRVSMPHNPVNSSTYSHVNGEHDLDHCGWSDFLEARANNQIGAKRSFSEDELDELSVADIACLKDVWQHFGAMDQWQLRDWTHDRANVPEWENPNGSSSEIPLERIMTLLGIENADEQAKIVEEHRHIDRVFSSLRD